MNERILQCSWENVDNEQTRLTRSLALDSVNCWLWIALLQKSAVKIILKNSYTNYKEALEILKMESLDERRTRLCLKFAKNCLKHEKMKRLFPLTSKNHSMKTRTIEKFKVNSANTERYKKSSIPYMQRLLNEDAKKIQKFLS